MTVEALLRRTSRLILGRSRPSSRRQSRNLDQVLWKDFKAQYPNVSAERIDKAVKLASRGLKAIIESEADEFGAADLEITLKTSSEISNALTAADYACT